MLGTLGWGSLTAKLGVTLTLVSAYWFETEVSPIKYKGYVDSPLETAAYETAAYETVLADPRN